MNIKKWSATAPSNIALIKYMGKSNSESNLPTNGSLSYTLNHLKTKVTIDEGVEAHDLWEPLNDEEYSSNFNLSEKGQSRFLKHFNFLKNEWGIKGSYIIKSANNFPSDCGLASSASSFAALTLATYELAKDKLNIDANVKILSDLSRKGSGSSCRSFFSPWSEWTENGANSFNDSQFIHLLHSVLVVESKPKEVSSSEAHLKVSTSELFAGRIERAQKRLIDLKKYLSDGNWSELYKICWQEFWDMHALFETSKEPFGYMSEKSLGALNMIRHFWNENLDGPIVTMDAGANIHLLYRLDQKNIKFEIEKSLKIWGHVLTQSSDN